MMRTLIVAGAVFAAGVLLMYLLHAFVAADWAVWADIMDWEPHERMCWLVFVSTTAGGPAFVAGLEAHERAERAKP